MIDFHCHIDLYPDPHEVAQRCADQGIYVLSVTTTPSAWKQSSALVGDAPRIRVALGLHPELARERKGELDLFDTFLPSCRYVGEIGLDGSPELKEIWSDQVQVFEHVLAACEGAGGRIMTIHSRRAADEVLDRLKVFKRAGQAVLHWYSGGSRSLDKAVDFGCWFSVGPGMIRGEKGRALIERMPKDRVLTETDGPFSNIKGKSAYPWDVDMVIVGLSEVWRMGADEVAVILNGNLRRLVSNS
ncbi:MAG TPA: Qat anti-phage system TatD family nuclease QatD [Xanthobacteraceae bacterium]|jgi:TatD DNase family protein|nr:Qat anti-phage system TatD family nuclease QatD [Xanthobacteraceae bacterium]